MKMEIVLANPRGFCAGVNRAIEIVERALEIFGAPIYVRHEVVHNRYVVNCLRETGAVFVDEVAEVPDNGTVIFSAHGVSLEVRLQAESRGLRVFDATCPLVTKVHLEVARFAKQGQECILIGHAGHPEVAGTMGQYIGGENGGIYLVETVEDVTQVRVRNPEQLAYVTQTTLSMDDTNQIVAALRQRFPGIQGPRKDDICYATQNRQDAVKQLAQESDIVLVVGSVTSSNSNRLKEVVERSGIPAYLIDGADDIHETWLQGKTRIGLTAGASAPEILVQGVIDLLQNRFGAQVRQMQGLEENVHFSLPRALVNTTAS